MKFRRDKKTNIEINQRGFDSYDFKLGDLFRGERATLGLSLMDVQRALKIKVEIISAIENCEISGIHDTVFIPGYVRSYAKYLNLDQDWVFEKFCQETDFLNPLSSYNKNKKINSTSKFYRIKTKSINNVKLSQSLKNSNKIYGQQNIRSVISLLSIFFMIVFFGSGGLFVLNAIQKIQIIEDENLPIIIEKADNLQYNFDSSGIKSDTGNEYYSSFTPRDGPIVEIDVNQTGVFLAKQNDFLTNESTDELTGFLDDNNDIQIFASRPAWVRIYTFDGKILNEKILDVSQTMKVPKNIDNALLRSGNAGSVFIKIGERSFGPIGEGTAVVKDILLSQDNILKSFKIVTDQNLLTPLKRIKIITEKSD